MDSLRSISFTNRLNYPYISWIYRLRPIISLYGFAGLLLLLISDTTTWQIQAQVLGQVDDNQALDFKKSVQDECTMISIAAAITAQIAITALSLSSVSQTHWLVQGLSVFSLTSALMAVYYATTQHRALGRQLTAKQVRRWIRGGNTSNDLIWPFTRALGPRQLRQEGDESGPPQWSITMTIPPSYYCDPEDFDSDIFLSENVNDVSNSLLRRCFMPGVAPVLTMSAPQFLLSMSLLALLLALGIYFGFIWMRKLDPNAGPHGSRNVFVMSIVGTGFCNIIFTVSRIIQSEDPRPELDILVDYMETYALTHTDWLHRQNLRVLHVEEGIRLTKIYGRDDTSCTGRGRTSINAGRGSTQHEREGRADQTGMNATDELGKSVHQHQEGCEQVNTGEIRD